MWSINPITNPNPSIVTKTSDTIFKKQSVAMSQKTQCFSIMKPNPLMFFTDIFAVSCESHMKSTNTFCGKNAEILVV
jgi:hypothetical protein